MTDRETIMAVVKDLDLPEGQWFLSGSGAMCLAGLRDHKPIGDIDIFCATRVWFNLMATNFYGVDVGLKLPEETAVVPVPVWGVYTTDPEDPETRCDPPYLYRTMHGIEVNVFSSWRIRNVGNIDVNNEILRSQEINGVPCISLEFLYNWKVEVQREKDQEDIAVFERCFAGEEAS